MPAKSTISKRSMNQMNRRVAFLTSSRVHVGPCRDPKPTASSGETLINLKRFITKTANASGQADLTVGDLYNMFGGAAFTFKISHIRSWCNDLTSGAVTFTMSNYSFDTTQDTNTRYTDAGNGRTFPACHFSIPPNIQKETVPSSGSTTNVCNAQGCRSGDLVAFEVTAEFRL